MKALFADTAFAARDRPDRRQFHQLRAHRGAVRLLLHRRGGSWASPPTFVVPTGNFGDIFAGEAAMRMGLAIERLVIATNANDIMARALNDGVYASRARRMHTLSPSMDIQVASQFRARAVRGLGPRRRLDVAPRWTISPATASWCLPQPVLAAAARPLQRLRQRRCRDPRHHRAVSTRDRPLIDPHTAVASPPPRKMRQAASAGGRPLDRPSGQIPRCRGPRHRHAARRAARGWRGLEDLPEKLDVLPNDAVFDSRSSSLLDWRA